MSGALVATTACAWADDPARPARPAPPVVIIAPPPPEYEPPRAEPAPPEPVKEEVIHRFEVSLAATMFPVALGNVRFVGNGVSAETGKRATFSHAGREVGLRNPTFWGAELSLGYRHTYFGVLVSGSLAAIGDADGRPTDPQAAGQLGTGSVTTYGGGLEMFGAVPIGRLTLSLGAAAGMRGFSAPLSGFAPTLCSRSSRRGSYTYPCAETASTSVTPWVQPRIRFDVSLDEKRTFFAGGFLGMDALGDRSFLGGLVIGLRFPSAP